MRSVSLLAALLLAGAGGVLAQDVKPKFGIGVKASTLGIGVEGATAVTMKSNVRAGLNFFSYSDDFEDDGINYAGELKLKSFQITYDQYLIGPFHISPGLLAYNDNHGTATAVASPGSSFTLGDHRYYSSSNDPVTGRGLLKFERRVSPMLLLGFGNLLPRSGRHFAFNVEFGAAYQGSPNATLDLRGTACDASATFCQNVATTSLIQDDVRRQQNKINDDLHIFRFYPIVSFGIGYSFGR